MAGGIRLTAATGEQYAPRVIARRRVSGYRRLAAVLAVVGVSPIPLCAAPTFTVNTAFDEPDASPDGVCETAKGSGVCSLRAAVMEANGTSGATIVVPALPAGARYLLTQQKASDQTGGSLTVYAPMTITGASAAGTIVDAIQASRVFEIDASDVTISNMTLTGGRASGGAGVSVAGFPVTLDHVVIRGNISVGSLGGGILSSGDLTVIGSAIVENEAPGEAGGGIASLNGSVMLVDSTISGNSASGAAGIAVSGTSVELANVTIANNTSGKPGHPGIDGGVEVYNGGVARIWNSVVAKNTAFACMPGGVGTCPPNPIVQVSSDCSDPTQFVSAAAPTSLGYNVFSSCNATGTGSAFDIVGDPLIGPLADNGGPTPTHALLAGSPAIDAGNPAGCADFLGNVLSTDQRGFPRPVGPRCDIGAYEVQPTTTTTTTTTLPGTGCAHAATLPSVDCRLAALRTLVTSNVPAGALQTQLLAALTQTRGKTNQVEALRAAGKKRPARSALGRAISALGSFTHRLKSRASRHLGSIKATLLSRAADLVRDLRILRHG
jgi:CSLREA domain-containing protein